MIKFFRKVSQKMLTQNKFNKYLIYAIGEIVLIVIGILIALQVNNWNEKRKESNIESQLIDILIIDLKSKNAEFTNDLIMENSMIQKSKQTIDNWNHNKEIDTLDLKYLLKKLSEDDWFFNTSSQIYSTVSGSGLWKKLPDSLSGQIDHIYRIRFNSIKTAFVKQSQYAFNTKSKFLAPNHLLDLNKSIDMLHKIVTTEDEKFISQLELFNSGLIRLASKTETTIISIDNLIENLENYKE